MQSATEGLTTDVATSVCQLIVVAKEPIAGRVKTRLSPPFSPEQAAELATAAIADTLSAVMATVPRARARGFVVEPVLVLDGERGPWLDGLLEWPAPIRVIPQCTGSFDVRLAAAFDDATAGSPGSHALLVGMDTPQITVELLLDAIESLATPGTDAVLGLADDGGWWALGLRTADRSLLLGVPMSTDETGAAQHARLQSAGLSVGLLAQLRDVDSAADAMHVAALSPHSRFARTLTGLRKALLVTT
jgi:glycosyltransferase A (GT-A) superfamily protein (DUF2064 family)